MQWSKYNEFSRMSEVMDLEKSEKMKYILYLNDNQSVSKNQEPFLDDMF